MSHEVTTTLTVNGTARTVSLPARTSLADALREAVGLTGTRLGCEHGVCGACTILLDGRPTRSCLTLVASCAGRDVRTVEGLTGPIADALRAAFSAEHALQCGFCTAGMLVTAYDVVQRRGRLPGPELSAGIVRTELSGNLCRCTGYVGVVHAILRAVETVHGTPGIDDPPG